MKGTSCELKLLTDEINQINSLLLSVINISFSVPPAGEFRLAQTVTSPSPSFCTIVVFTSDTPAPVRARAMDKRNL